MHACAILHCVAMIRSVIALKLPLHGFCSLAGLIAGILLLGYGLVRGTRSIITFFCEIVGCAFPDSAPSKVLRCCTMRSLVHVLHCWLYAGRDSSQHVVDLKPQHAAQVVCAQVNIALDQSATSVIAAPARQGLGFLSLSLCCCLASFATVLRLGAL